MPSVLLSKECPIRAFECTQLLAKHGLNCYYFWMIGLDDWFTPTECISIMSKFGVVFLLTFN